MQLDNNSLLVLVLVIVSFLALASFVGVILLSNRLGAQSNVIKVLKEEVVRNLEYKLVEAEATNLRLQSVVDTMNAILKNWLQSEQKGLPVDLRQVQIANWLDQLNKLPTMSVNIGGSAVGGAVSGDGNLFGDANKVSNRK